MDLPPRDGSASYKLERMSAPGSAGEVRGVWLGMTARVMRHLLARAGRRESLPDHLRMGERGEIEALLYLRSQGYTIVARRWRSAKLRGDLDLVAWDGPTLCFIEVKTRTSRSFATAESSVDDDKTRVLRRMARQYLHMLPIAPSHVRFDVLSIYYEVEKPADYQLFRGAFDWH